VEQAEASRTVKQEGVGAAKQEKPVSTGKQEEEAEWEADALEEAFDALQKGKEVKLDIFARSALWSFLREALHDLNILARNAPMALFSE